MENKRKPWKKLTPQEIQNLTNRQCTDCKFYPKSNGTSGKMQTCDYIFMVGHSRGCDPRDCVKEGKFEYAATKVAMGNASPKIKELADYVTTDMFHYGIRNGLEHLGLI